MVNAYVYILRCADGTYYVGSTTDLTLRLSQHHEGAGSAYTRCRLPVALVYVEEFDSIDACFRREKQLQGWSRAKKEALIAQRFLDLPGLAERHSTKRRHAELRRDAEDEAREHMR